MTMTHDNEIMSYDLNLLMPVMHDVNLVCVHMSSIFSARVAIDHVTTSTPTRTSWPVRAAASHAARGAAMHAAHGCLQTAHERLHQMASNAPANVLAATPSPDGV